MKPELSKLTAMTAAMSMEFPRQEECTPSHYRISKPGKGKNRDKVKKARKQNRKK